jgi:uncharacterized membrane protein YgdD (TMEM256/DUF423 family)
LKRKFYGEKILCSGLFFRWISGSNWFFRRTWLAKNGSMVPIERLTAWEKAVRYQMYHAFALFFVAWAITQWWDQAKTLKAAGWFFMLGTILFSGSLYILVFTGTLTVKGIGFLVYLTPAGGVAYMIGWLLLMKAAWKAQDR